MGCGAERVSRNQLHDERVRVLVFGYTINLRDVRMIERGQQLGLALEARHPLRVFRKGSRQNLQRHITFQLRVLGPVNLAHAAYAERSENFVRAKAITD